MPSFAQSRSPLFLFAAAAFSAIVLHCGGSSTTSGLFAEDDASQANEAGAVGDGNANGADGHALVDSAVTGQGGDGGGGDSATAVVPDGGLPPTAGSVACGTTPACDDKTQTCCAFNDGGATCVATTGASACGGGGGNNTVAVRACDETADCPASLVCCYELGDNGLIGSGCHADCGGNGGKRVQACRQQAECTSGSCAVRTCNGGGTIEACGALDNACL